MQQLYASQRIPFSSGRSALWLRFGRCASGGAVEPSRNPTPMKRQPKNRPSFPNLSSSPGVFTRSGRSATGRCRLFQAPALGRRFVTAAGGFTSRQGRYDADDAGKSFVASLASGWVTTAMTPQEEAYSRDRRVQQNGKLPARTNRPFRWQGRQFPCGNVASMR